MNGKIFSLREKLEEKQFMEAMKAELLNSDSVLHVEKEKPKKMIDKAMLNAFTSKMVEKGYIADDIVALIENVLKIDDVNADYLELLANVGYALDILRIGGFDNNMSINLISGMLSKLSRELTLCMLKEKKQEVVGYFLTKLIPMVLKEENIAYFEVISKFVDVVSAYQYRHYEDIFSYDDENPLNKLVVLVEAMQYRNKLTIGDSLDVAAVIYAAVPLHNLHLIDTVIDSFREGYIDVSDKGKDELIVWLKRELSIIVDYNDKFFNGWIPVSISGVNSSY
jgi:hypothetical protein